MANLRFAAFNASLNRTRLGELQENLSSPDNSQAKAVAETIQRLNADVILINEFDFTDSELDAGSIFEASQAPTRGLLNNYLGLSQGGANATLYPYVYIAPSNTGIASGFDLNNNGVTVNTIGAPGYGDDAFGFGNFPGQFGMVLLSKYPIDRQNVRTFQDFLWKDMPGGLLTNDPTAGANNLRSFYSPQEIEVLRLSSKSHWDIPIQTPDGIIHVLASHPTPPVFDGPEDRNGKRNFDEIRFWSDYITPGRGNYIYDDNGGTGGIVANGRFVIMGDQNADPLDGDSFNFAINQLLNNPRINNEVTPSSPGGVQQKDDGGINNSHRGNSAFDTADFGDGLTAAGNLRADYVLPSRDLRITNAGVFWPQRNDPLFPLVGERGSLTTFQNAANTPASDHSAVFVDLNTAVNAPVSAVSGVRFLGQQVFNTSTNFQNTQVGGLSSITYDPVNNRYFAISDDRGDRTAASSVASPPPANNTSPRFYSLNINPSAIANGVTFTGNTTLRDSNNNPFASLATDPEGLVFTTRGTLFASSEGEVNPTAGRVTNPFVAEFDLASGRQLRSLPVPQKFLPVVNSAGVSTSGIRNNLAFESLAITPDQRFLFTATENALVQDGSAASVSSGSRSRILKYDLITGLPTQEFLYPVDPVALAPVPGTAFATNGLVELLSLDNGGNVFLALERSFSTGATTPGNTGNTIKLYEVRLDNASDISGINSLSSLSTNDLNAIRPAQKRLLLNFDTLGLANGSDNIEGLALGPVLGNGKQSLLAVSDNNFSATQFTQFLAFELDLGNFASNFRFAGGTGTLPL